jgi:hypothetical protein
MRFLLCLALLSSAGCGGSEVEDVCTNLDEVQCAHQNNACTFEPGTQSCVQSCLEGECPDGFVCVENDSLDDCSPTGQCEGVAPLIDLCRPEE